MDEEKTNEERKNGGLSLIRRPVLLALLAAVLVLGACCVRAFGQYHALKAPYIAALREANDAYNAAVAERAEADPESETSAALRRQASEDMIAEGKAQIAEIERHNAELDEQIREAEAKISKLDEIEDYAYFRAIYDEYAEGRAYVENLLAKD